MYNMSELNSLLKYINKRVEFLQQAEIKGIHLKSQDHWQDYFVGHTLQTNTLKYIDKHVSFPLKKENCFLSCFLNLNIFSFYF